MKVTTLSEPFPHLIVDEVYEDHELELIWEEFKFFNKPGKLQPPERYGGVMGRTNAKAIALSDIFSGRKRCMSNILNLERPLMERLIPYLKAWRDSHYSIKHIPSPERTYTKLRYYYDGEGYGTHVDKPFAYIIFSYFYKEPKKFTGGQLFFEDFDYEFPCNNNSLIVIPPYVAHGVRTVNIDENDYYAGNGRYAITTFVDYHRLNGLNANDDYEGQKVDSV